MILPNDSFYKTCQQCGKELDEEYRYILTYGLSTAHTCSPTCACRIITEIKWKHGFSLNRKETAVLK